MPNADEPTLQSESADARRVQADGQRFLHAHTHGMNDHLSIG